MGLFNKKKKEEIPETSSVPELPPLPKLPDLPLDNSANLQFKSKFHKIVMLNCLYLNRIHSITALLVCKYSN